MKTYAPKPRDIERRWYVVDAQGAVLGRLASEVAMVLRGKHKPIYAPHADTGDHVVVINARGIRLTGGKETKKVAYRHSGYPGGISATGYDRLLSERPRSVVEKAVKGMLPHNRLGRAMFGKLKVYEGSEHPHGAQKPVPLKLGELPAWEGLPAPRPKPEPAAEEQPKKAKRAAAKTTAAKATVARKSPAKAAAATTKPKASAAKRTTAKTTAKKGGAEKKPVRKRTKKAEEE